MTNQPPPDRETKLWQDEAKLQQELFTILDIGTKAAPTLRKIKPDHKVLLLASEAATHVIIAFQRGKQEILNQLDDTTPGENGGQPG